METQIGSSAFDFDFAAARVGHNVVSGLVDGNIAGAGAKADGTLGFLDFDVAGAGVDLRLALDAAQLNIAAAGVRGDVAGNRNCLELSGTGLEIDGTFDAVDFHVTRAGVAMEFRFGGDFDRVVDTDIVEAGAGATDLNQIALLRNRRIVLNVGDAFLLIFKAPVADFDLAVNADFAGSAG